MVPILGQVVVTGLSVAEVLSDVVTDNVTTMLSIAATVTFLGLIGAAISSFRGGAKRIAKARG
jgi:hypothetical protein